MSDNHVKTGVIIILEGNEATGKTTMAQRLINPLSYLYDNEAVYLREPGGDELTNKIRDLILYNNMEPLTELLLFNASRSININKYILPELRKGKIVVMDRFVDSTYVYQGILNSFDNIEALNKMVIPKEFYDYPCMRLLLHCEDIQVLCNRLNNENREHNKYDKADEIHLSRINQRYKSRFVHEKYNNSGNVDIIDVNRSENEVFTDILDASIKFIGEYC